MGEEEKHLQKAIPEAVQAMIVDTLGGRVQVSWDKESAATPFVRISRHRGHRFQTIMGSHFKRSWAPVSRS